MTLYLLYYDTNEGDREEWNVFYTPCEIYSTEQLRQDRITVLEGAVDEEGDPRNYEFEKQEVVIDTPAED